MNDILSLWHSPLDKVAVADAEELSDRQPRGTIIYQEDFTQITIFNYGQYIYLAGGIANADTALDNMFQAMTAPYSPYGYDGGLAYILQQNYLVNAYDPLTQLHLVPDQCNLLACGMGGDKGNASSNHFYHFKISPQASAGHTSTFLTCTGDHTTGGKWFRGIAFEWAQTNAKVGDICISAGTWNCIAVDCNFTNCPTAFYASGEASGLERCTINYLTGSPDNAVAVYLQAVLSFVSGGVYHQDSVASGGPTGCTAIALGGGSGMGSLFHGVVCNLHLGEWSYGIHYGFNPGVSGTNVTAILAQSYITCVMMQPPSSGNNEINGEKYGLDPVSRTL